MSRLHPRRFARAAAASVLALGLVAAPVVGAATADDEVFKQGLQWGLEKIGAPQAWDAARGEGITIAIVDSGIDLRHEDLADKVVAHTSCLGTQGDPARCSGSAQDDNGHGTHVAGIAAASTNNGVGIAGVAPDAKLIAVRVLANECSKSGCTATGTAGDVAAGIRWAVDHGADIVNLSLGGGTLQALGGCAFCDAIDYAWSKGVIAVIAAGNDSLLPTGFGDEPAVVVTATTRDDERASYSNSSSGILRSARWPVAAPGGEGETAREDCATGGRPKGILSTYWISGEEDEYACLAGTSMAAPHVSGALALLRSEGLAPLAAVERLLGTARDLGPAGRDPSFGVGLIDLARAAGPPRAGDTTSTAPATSAPPDSSTLPPTTGAPGTTGVATTPGTEDTTPAGTLPTSEQAAPFGGRAEAGDEPDAWLVALAIALLVGTAIANASVAWTQAGRADSS